MVKKLYGQYGYKWSNLIVYNLREIGQTAASKHQKQNQELKKIGLSLKEKGTPAMEVNSVYHIVTNINPSKVGRKSGHFSNVVATAHLPASSVALVSDSLRLP